MRIRLLFLLCIHFILCCNLLNDEDMDALLSNLKIYSSINKNKDNFESIILNKCIIDKYFQLKNDNNKQEVYDSTSVTHRILRFHIEKEKYYQRGIKRALSIKLLHHQLQGDGNVTIPVKEFTLKENEQFDSFIIYQCNKSKQFSTEIDIIINKENVFQIKLNKICSDNEADAIDISHMLVIFFIVIVIYISNNSNVYSNFEDTFLNKFPELRNPQNLSIILLTILLLLWCFYLLNLLSIWIVIASILIIPSSFALICEIAINLFQINEDLPVSYFENTILGIFSIQFFIFYCIGCIIYLLYYITSFWFICDILAMCFCIGNIRLIKFTSFKYMMFISLTIWIYDIIWCCFESQFFTLNSRLDLDTSFILPLVLYVPEFSFNFYTTYIYLSVVDVIISGTLINYFRRVDMKIKYRGNLYYLISFTGLISGCFIRILIYTFFYLPLPCFSIIYPCITLPVLITAYFKRELSHIMKGFKETVFAENEMESTQLNNFAISAYAESTVTLNSSGVEMKLL